VSILPNGAAWARTTDLLISVIPVKVEVEEGSVLLPCQYTGFVVEDPTMIWTRTDLNPKSVHLRQEETDDLSGQNQRYSGRTSMRPDALDTGDFSLTLRNPRLTDSGDYTCSIRTEREELKLTDVQLHVKGKKNPITTGDLSLTLKHPTERDSGGYICTIYRGKDILTQKVVLQVKGQRCSYRSEVSAD
uniref:Ig-like domain-containing protein n=1 Tax=Pundamilia nyererei TaxID=303518 RepID=A0A3B4FAB4_9CICH